MLGRLWSATATRFYVTYPMHLVTKNHCLRLSCTSLLLIVSKGVHQTYQDYQGLRILLKWWIAMLLRPL